MSSVLRLRVRSGIVDTVLTVVIDFVILYFIGKLVTILGFIIDLQRLKSTEKLGIRKIDVPVAGSVSRTLGGCVTIAMIMVLFISILIAENGINGTTIETRHKTRFREARYVSINNFEGSLLQHDLRLPGVGRLSDCQYLYDGLKVLYAQLLVPELDSIKGKLLCSNGTDNPITTLEVSQKIDTLSLSYRCRSKTTRFVGNISIDSRNIVYPVMRCNVEVLVSGRVKHGVSDAKLWFFRDIMRSADRPAKLLLTYKNGSDPSSFYRIASADHDSTSGRKYHDQFRLAGPQVFQVREEYFEFVEDDNFLSYSKNTMVTNCKNVRCFMRHKQSGLSAFTVATWLLWIQNIRTLQLTLDISFQKEYAKIIFSNKTSGNKASASLHGVEVKGPPDTVDGTEVSLYSVVILSCLAVGALIAAVICNVAKCKRWKWRGVDLALHEQNQLLCKTVNDLRSRYDEECLKDVKKLKLVSTICETGNEMRISAQEKMEKIEKHDSQVKQLENGAV